MIAPVVLGMLAMPAWAGEYRDSAPVISSVPAPAAYRPALVRVAYEPRPAPVWEQKPYKRPRPAD